MAENHNQKAAETAWKDTREDMALYFESENIAQHDDDVLARTGLHPTMDLYRWASRVKD